MNNNIRLFGKQTNEDWLAVRAKIMSEPNNLDDWNMATNLLWQRLETRYFRPIEEILRMRIATGEGFCIMVLICSLIEFLQSCYEGKSYDMGKSETKFIYGSSKKKFEDFLVGHEPFKGYFSKRLSKPIGKITTFAEDFYLNVRCGLLHEAATKNGWMIKSHRAGAAKKDFVDLSDECNKKIYRDEFYKSLKSFCEDYLTEIKDDKKVDGNMSLRNNFCRRMDSLCEIKGDKSIIWWK